MNMLGKAFRTLWVWVGLVEPPESQLTPGHGWLLPSAAEARVQRRDLDARRAAHLLGMNDQG
jgi:hypothetical protein